MKLIAIVGGGLFLTVQLNAAEVLPQKSVVLMLPNGAETGEARADVEKYKTNMAGRGISVT